MRVDFYLLDKEERTNCFLLACKLLEKAYLKGHTVFVYSDNQEEAETLDELLWTFKDDSFIPHNLQGEGPEPPPVIQIGYQGEPRGFSDILLNLSEQVPPFFQRFKRIMEIIRNQEEAKDRGRERFKHYKKNNCSLFTHSIQMDMASL
jgi:DNA polymerase-3 subunit chi